jgi:hypothetical protein
MLGLHAVPLGTGLPSFPIPPLSPFTTWLDGTRAYDRCVPDLPSSWSQPWTKFGDWWDPSNPEQTVSGTLTYDPVDGLRLDANSGHVLSDLFQPERADAVINGRAESEYWTLADCFATGSTFRSTFSAMTVRIGFAIAGVDLSRDDLAQLTELRLSFHELRWLVDMPRRRPDQLQSEPAALHAMINEGLQLSLETELTYVDDDPDQLTYLDQLQFVARTATPTTFKELVNQTYQPVRDLLMLMAQRAVSLSYCAVSGPATTYDQGGRPVVDRCLAYWNVMPSPRRPATAIKRPLRSLESTQTGFDTQMRRWFAHHSLLQLPISLRTSYLVADPGFNEPRFLASIQALEALHRRIHPSSVDTDAAAARDAALAAVHDSTHRRILRERLAHVHEPTLRYRLNELIADVPAYAATVLGESAEAVVGRMIKARNAITHWSPSKPHPRGLQLAALRLACDALFDLEMFDLMGLSDEELARVGEQINLERKVRYWLDRAANEPPNS